MGEDISAAMHRAMYGVLTAGLPMCEQIDGSIRIVRPIRNDADRSFRQRSFDHPFSWSDTAR
jgi:hypothetical protein